MVPGTTMSFAGLTRGSERADLIAYLNSWSDSPQPLPKAAEAAQGQSRRAEAASIQSQRPGSSRPLAFARRRARGMPRRIIRDRDIAPFGAGRVREEPKST